MNSCLYECHVMHARLAPRAHRFSYRIFLFALDLDELDALPRRLPLFSLERSNFYSFRERDHLPIDEPRFDGRAVAPGVALPPSSTLKQRVARFLALHGVNAVGGRTLLITLPRVLGYGFNPVSFYFCFDRAGVPLAAIAEVTNTFREVKPYFLGPNAFSAAHGEFRLRGPKHFYVSPFTDVDVAFDFTLRLPSDRIAMQIDDLTGRARTFTSTLTGTRTPLTSARLVWFTLKYPFITLRVIGLIHWHALRLWLKRVPWFAKAERAADQRDLHRPHASLVAQSPNAPELLAPPTTSA